MNVGFFARLIMPIFVVWQLSIAFLVAFAVVVFFVITRNRRTMLYICRYLAIFSAFAGFSVYTLGYLQPHFLVSDIPNAAMRAVISTIGMLFLSTDYLALSGWLAESIWREIFFWAIHLAAFIVIQAAFISLFGRRIQDYCRLRFGFQKELYIINGCTKNALMLGEDIISENGKKGKEKKTNSKSLVVFLLNEEDDSKKTYEKVMHFGGIVQVIDGKHNLKTFLRVAGLGKRACKNRVFHIVYMPSEMHTVRDVTEIVEYANKANNKKRGSVMPDNLRLYVLTSCDLERAAIERITQKKENGHRVYPYYFRIHTEEGLLAGQIIKKEPPYSLKKFSFDESGDFTIMVLGFGTMGANALLQILRNIQLDGRKVRALIVDTDKHLVESFKRRYPMIDKLCCDIKSINIDVREDKCVKTTISEEKPDYIIVSYSNDRENLELAHDISKCYNKTKYKPAPVIAVSQKFGRKEDFFDDLYGTKILFFGNEREIYKRSVIINEDNDDLAKVLLYSYRGKDEDEDKDKTEGEPEEAKKKPYDKAKADEQWNKLDWVSQESERASAEFIPGILKLMDCKDTKELIERLAITEHMRWCAFHATMGFDLIAINELQPRYDELVNNRLSELDALTVCRKDVKNRLHACLVSWEKLDEINKVYFDIANKAYNNAGDRKNNKDWKYARNRGFKQEYRDIIDIIPEVVDTHKLIKPVIIDKEIS